MDSKPSKKRLLANVGQTDNNADGGRRRVLQSGFVAAVVSAVGLGGLVSTSSASGQDDSFAVVRKTASKKRLSEADLLLQRLADDNLIPNASPSAFSAAPLGTNDSGSAVLRYGDRVVHTFVVRENGTKLTVNLPENESPYAIYAPDGSGAGKRVRYDQIKGAVDATVMEYTQNTVGTQDVTTAGDCGSSCGGATCSPAGNCWLQDRYCSEDCRSDGAGGYYCHDDCQCGC
jgi:hypothetical protein